MNLRETAMAILKYQDFDKLPVTHFGFWNETIDKWTQEGYLPESCGHDYTTAARYCGFDADFDWSGLAWGAPDCWNAIQPPFEPEVVAEFPDGTQHIRNSVGAVEVHKPEAGSIPGEVDHLLKDRESWEKYYLPKLQYDENRVPEQFIQTMKNRENSEVPVGYFAGSLIGEIRNYIGVEGLAYIYADDEDLMKEIVDTIGELRYQETKKLLESGVKIDYIHYWEDVCFKNGPLITPSFFEEFVGPHYGRISELAKSHGVDFISVDCDGCIDKLIPTWLDNGVEIMFPIEVGTWNASIAPWREKYGKIIKGVGGMNKTVFSRDRKAVDEEIERLKRLVALGGYIPCPDHRIAPDAKFELVQYYCDRMHNEKF